MSTLLSEMTSFFSADLVAGDLVAVIKDKHVQLGRLVGEELVLTPEGSEARDRMLGVGKAAIALVLEEDIAEPEKAAVHAAPKPTPKQKQAPPAKAQLKAAPAKAAAAMEVPAAVQSQVDAALSAL